MSTPPSASGAGHAGDEGADIPVVEDGDDHRSDQLAEGLPARTAAPPCGPDHWCISTIISTEVHAPAFRTVQRSPSCRSTGVAYGKRWPLDLVLADHRVRSHFATSVQAALPEFSPASHSTSVHRSFRSELHKEPIACWS